MAIPKVSEYSSKLKTMKKSVFIMLTAGILLSTSTVNFAQAPALGAASGFAVFTSVGAFNLSGPADISMVTGDVGTNAGAFYGFPPGTLIGQKHIEDAISLQTAADLSLAYGYLSTLSGAVLGSLLGNGQILSPGIYSVGSAATLNGNLTLNGEGNPDALFIIKINGALATSNFTNVFLINSASLQNVYWQINGAFTLGDYSVFRGTVIANGQIELLEGSSLAGRGLTIAGSILMHNNHVTLTDGSIIPVTIPTLTEWALILLGVFLLGIGVFYILQRRQVC